MRKSVFCALMFCVVACLLGCSFTDSEMKSENEAAIVLSLDETEESMSVNDSDFSEGDLLALFEAVNNEDIREFVYDDYNKDGIHEAFVLTQEDDCCKLWYVHSKECQIVCENLENLDNPAITVLDFNTKAYLLVQQSENDIRNTLVYSIDNNNQVVEAGISQNGRLVKTEDDEIWLQIDQKQATENSFTVDTKTYYLYYVYDEGFREYGGIPIGLEQFLEFEGSQEIIDHISELYSDYDIEYSFLYRANHYINVNVTLLKEESAAVYKNMTLTYDDVGVTPVSENPEDGKIEIAHILNIATFPTAFKHPKNDKKQ